MDKTDGTSDLARKHRRKGGVLRQMSDRQSDVKELISGLRKTEDKTVIEGLAGNLGYDDDLVVACVLASLEMGRDPDRQIEIEDLIWAGAFLDHLDTQGFAVSSK